ncbi:MAG: type III-B CRISPR module-associated protein Cmr5 [Aquificae bacterium]|nr:type III-B CRISPR module-associated protein Cmr5 [Aquificota bacterium]
MQTLNQRYAQEVFKLIEKVAENDKLKKDFLPLVRKLPSRITHNGLLTTLAFLYSKATFNKETQKPTDAPAVVLSALVSFLKDGEVKTETTKDKVQSFIKSLTETNFLKLMLYSQKALTFSQWLKRLAEGTFKEGDDAE